MKDKVRWAQLKSREKQSQIHTPSFKYKTPGAIGAVLYP